ncbi:hypothetical protein VULLAG_LOCUS7881 [Vulpes lagopus]
MHGLVLPFLWSLPQISAPPPYLRLHFPKSEVLSCLDCSLSLAGASHSVARMPHPVPHFVPHLVSLPCGCKGIASLGKPPLIDILSLPPHTLLPVKCPLSPAPPTPRLQGLLSLQKPRGLGTWGPWPGGLASPRNDFCPPGKSVAGPTLHLERHPQVSVSCKCSLDPPTPTRI